MSFMQAPQEVFFQRGDTDDPRLGELVAQQEPSAPAIGIIGYPDDEGIRRNGGRAGSAEAPHAIRRVLYKMTPTKTKPQFWDHGDLVVENSLEDRHKTARANAHSLLKKGHRLLSFGGGHDYGFADGAAFLDWARDHKLKPVVINFDAHLDVRPLDRGLTSGTPFFRLLNEFKEFDFVEVGIQGQCNSNKHLEWVKNQGAQILSLEEAWASGKSLTDFLVDRLQDVFIKRRPAFVSVDIDAFAWPYAIGASQSWPTGLEPREFFPALDFILHRLDVRSLGIYEVSPPLEFDQGTSKLAALIAHKFIHHSHHAG